MIKKQANHLIYEINHSKILDDKMLSCAAIFLLVYATKIIKIFDIWSKFVEKISNLTLITMDFQNPEILNN